MKKVLVISPYFPPGNAADMQRVRISLPYFRQFGWEAEIVTVDPQYSDLEKDNLLLESIPPDTVIHYVAALSKNWTSKLGLGSIALRSIWFFRAKVNALLKGDKYDLIYFSTTQFPVCILGAYWKKRFGIPYVIDMQDPWHSDYYQDKPKEQRPSKYWFSYRLNKWLEPIAMRQVAGLISVSADYITDLKTRYPKIKNVPAQVITFAASEEDFRIAEKHMSELMPVFTKQKDLIELVYVGRGGQDLHKALRIIFKGFKNGLNENLPVFENFRFHFFGTSYAPSGKGIVTILPLARELGISKYVYEDCHRMSYYQSLRTLLEADILIVPGSDDPKYTASKIFNFILAAKPLLSVFSPSSSTYRIVSECNAGEMLSFDDKEASSKVCRFLQNYLSGNYEKPILNSGKFNEYSAAEMVKKQCLLFESVL